MLKQRIITASILATVVISAVLELPSDYFSLLIALIVLIAAWEWLNLIDITSTKQRVFFVGTLIFAMSFLHLWTYILEALVPTFDYLAEKYDVNLDGYENKCQTNQMLLVHTN